MQKQVDLTLKVVIVSVFLTILLAVSNTYLALKVGILTAASIPAAILSMGIMKFFRSSTIYEHNLVQTAASSGEAIAGGVGYTVPALVIIGFAHGFHYFDTFLLALTGGVIGVMFSTIIRKPLLSDQSLRFPEGQAISEVLKLREAKLLGFKDMLIGSGLAAVIELFQSTGLMLAGGVKFLVSGASLFGLGLGLSPALIGAGYIVGIRVGLSLLLGAVLAYGVVLPCLSHGLAFLPNPGQVFEQKLAMSMRYVGVGGMLCAALVTLLGLLKPIYRNVAKTLSALSESHFLPVQEQDLSRRTVIFCLVGCLVVLMLLLNSFFKQPTINLSSGTVSVGVAISLLFILIVGFMVAIVCGYFSGLVGVSASPGSSVLIGALILAALMIHAFFSISGIRFTQNGTLFGEAVTIIITSIVMQIACIANDTVQDLKVGQLIGASPRKQQIMLLFGVFIASLVVPFIMEIMYRAYGIAGQMPYAGMDVEQSLAAPPAAIMAALTGTIFTGSVPVKMLAIGAGVMLALVVCQRILARFIKVEVTFLAVGIGMYLSLANSTPLIIGAIISYVVSKISKDQVSLQSKVVLACGCIAGATIMDVLLAVPIALSPGARVWHFTLNTKAAAACTVIGMLLLLWVWLKPRGAKASA